VLDKARKGIVSTSPRLVRSVSQSSPKQSTSDVLGPDLADDGSDKISASTSDAGVGFGDASATSLSRSNKHNTGESLCLCPKRIGRRIRFGGAGLPIFDD